MNDEFLITKNQLALLNNELRMTNEKIKND